MYFFANCSLRPAFLFLSHLLTDFPGRSMGCITVYGGQVYQFFAFFAVFGDADAFFIHLAQPILGHGGFDVEFAALQGLFEVMAGFGVISCDAASQEIKHPQHGLGFWQALFGGFGVPKGGFFIFFVTVKIGIA